MRTSRLLLALGAIQLLIVFTCMALPSIRSSSRKRSTSFAARSTQPSTPPSSFVWQIDEARPALQVSFAVKMKPYELWLLPPASSFLYIQPPEPLPQQGASVPASGSGLGQARFSQTSPSFRKPNPKYAMKFNMEALKQQQQQQQRSNDNPPPPSASMFNSRATTCSGNVNFRCQVTPAASQRRAYALEPN
jgi:hypothetical protein